MISTLTRFLMLSVNYTILRTTDVFQWQFSTESGIGAEK